MEKKTFLLSVLIFGALYYSCMSQEGGIIDYATPKDCLAFYTKDQMGVALQCEVDFVSSQALNFSVIPSKYTQSLKFTCTWLIYKRSSLANISFPAFEELKEVVFLQCKFESLGTQDLSSLRENLLYLTIRSEHDDSQALRVQNSAIGNLSKLQALDLAHNNMAEFPAKELCPLSDLQEAVFHHNCLIDITSFGFSGSCLQDDLANPCAGNLQMLDLSHNHVTILPSKSFCKTRHLKQLNLEQNNISIVEDGAFSNLHSLERLVLSLNRITHVGPKTWTGLEQLNFLNISHNEISANLNADTFKGLEKLQTLDLGFNHIRDISKASLMQLTNLTYLSLASNQIERLEGSLFSSLTKLQVLLLQENLLTTIAEDTFSGMPNLKLLSMEGNRLTAVADRVFQNSIQLIAIFLGNNNLTTLPIISHLSALLVLDLSTNKFDSLSSTSFVGLDSLQQLSLKSNILGTLPENLFSNLASLSELDLSNNAISILGANTFSKNLKLKSLSLERNSLSEMFNLQLNTQLANLDLSYNALKSLIYGFLPISLKVLKVDHNRIKSVEEVLYTANSTTITHLDLSNNGLTVIGKTSLPPTLQVVDLDFNDIFRIQSFSFASMKSLQTVSMQGNMIKSMHKENLATHPECPRRPKFQLGGNQLQCQCEMLWMKTINGPSNDNYAYVDGLSNMYCWLPKRNQPNQADIVLILDSPESNFLCPFTEHTFTPTLCQPSSPKAFPQCNITCPNPCSCLRDMSWNNVIVICSLLNQTEVPRGVPALTSALYLDGNNISEIGPSSFELQPKLRELYLNGSNLRAVATRSFVNLPNLITLHLEHNQLQELTVGVFTGLVNLAQLYLFSNHLRYMHEEVFQPLSSLHTLALQNNQLTNFPVSEFSRMLSLSSITLGENLWSCDCDYVDKYHEWFQQSARKIVDIENLMCYPESEGEAISLINFNATFCVDQSQLQLNYIPVTVSMSIIFVAIAGICVLIFIYRHEMQVLLYSRYGVRLLHRNREVDDEKKIYDAFISYSNDDEDLVVTRLLPKLEDIEFPYKLCLHQRDFAVGAFITESILEAVEYSRRTIMILTESFVQSEWCRFEFKTAHMQMMKDKCNRVIVIVLGKIPKTLDPEMKLYLNTNTYLQWDDKLFWQKLYFALPEKRPKH